MYLVIEITVEWREVCDFASVGKGLSNPLATKSPKHFWTLSRLERKDWTVPDQIWLHCLTFRLTGLL